MVTVPASTDEVDSVVHYPEGPWTQSVEYCLQALDWPCGGLEPAHPAQGLHKKSFINRELSYCTWSAGSCVPCAISLM
jgi:hypothetical protein